MQFSFTYAPGTSLDQMIGFETAGRLWASHLTDNVTVNIYVEPTNTLPVGVAGGALMGVEADLAYSTWRTKLAADRTSATDQTIHQNLPGNTSSFTAWVNDIDATGMTSNKSEQSSNTLNLSRANAKALEITNGQGAALDGYILMNNQLSDLGLDWNYSLDGNLPANSVDFLSVAVHEIGHVLGFYSGVDASGWQITPIDGFYSDDDDDDDDGGNGGGGERDPRGPLQNATGLDMLRFSNEDKIDLVVGGSPFFSIDGGTTKRADFATGVDRNLGGDGYQASHWKASGGSLGIMEPSIAPGQRRNLLSLDQEGLDAIGWDAGTGQANLTDLQNQAKAALAGRLGLSVAQLEANPAAVQQLTQDRGSDALAMIDQSQIYEWRASRRARRSGYWGTLDLPAAGVMASDPVSESLVTGWNPAAVSPDRLTAGGESQFRSAFSQQTVTQQTSPDPLTASSLTASSLALSPALGYATSITASTISSLDALSPNYLIGSELLQAAV